MVPAVEVGPVRPSIRCQGLRRSWTDLKVACWVSAYVAGVEVDPWVEVEWDLGEELWADFVAEFGGWAGFGRQTVIAPEPSVVWDLSPVFDGSFPGEFAAGRVAVAGLVLGTLQDCTEWYESVAFHDGVHPSALFRPHAVDVRQEVPGRDGGGLFPDGDFIIFVPGIMGTASSGIPGRRACACSVRRRSRRSGGGTPGLG